MHVEEVSWVLTTGEAGMRSQALGLAEAVGLSIVEKRIAVRPPWTWLPGGLLPMPLWALCPSSDPLKPPWPRLVIACGRRSIGPALSIKRLSRGRTVAAYVQNPDFARAGFDLVAAMPHDGVHGSNVVTVRTALHPVTQAKLDAARGDWRSQLAADGPLLGVLVGGDNASYRLTPAIAARLVRILRNAAAKHGLRAAVTPSRRTGDATKRFLAKAIEEHALGTMWDETGSNPYLGILALADRLIVTGESISMISEALATGRPVHVLPLAGRGRRHARFLQGIVEERLVSLIEGDDLDWAFAGAAPIDSAAEPAAQLRGLLAARA
ncbi:MAG: mitochondrial fission ELM1 family protein [Propylenella sp.]